MKEIHNQPRLENFNLNIILTCNTVTYRINSETKVKLSSYLSYNIGQYFAKIVCICRRLSYLRFNICCFHKLFKKLRILKKGYGKKRNTELLYKSCT